MDITILFCEIDDFCQVFEPEFNSHLLEDGKRKRLRKKTLALSEVMTIIIEFQRSGYRTFIRGYNFAFLLSVSSGFGVMPNGSGHQ